jgi:hypothetical protein
MTLAAPREGRSAGSDTGGIWSLLLDALAGAEKDIVEGCSRVQSPLLRAEGLRYLTRLFAAGALTELEASDPAYPQLVPFVSTWITWGGTNPDADYLYAALHPDYSYHLRGTRGRVHLFAVETYAGDFTDMARIQACGTRYDVLGGPGNIAYGPRGEFDIVLSREEREGNWLPIPDGAAHLLVRSCYYDWDVTDRPHVVIEREGASFPPPSATVDAMTGRLERFLQFLRIGPQICAKAADMYFSADSGTVRFPPWSLQGDPDYEHQISLRDQLYGQGHYQCDAGEAVLLEVAVPPCPYWSFNLSSPYLENSEWHLRQNSINGHQSVIDSDGVFRAVIAHEDPGVPNWLDTGNHTAGIIQGRFLLPACTPQVTLQVVPLSQLRDRLPVDTPVVSPEARHEALRQRALAVQRRGHW